MILARVGRVKRTVWPILGVLALLVTVAWLRFGVRSDAVAEISPAEAPPIAAALSPVQVRHEFVTVSVPLPAAVGARPPSRAVRPRKSPSAEAVASVVRARSTPRDKGDRSTLDPSEDSPGLLLRAGRLVVGDGRHRPEPFPRIKKQP